MSSGQTRYRVPAGEARADFVVKRSLFVGTAGPADSIPEAVALIDRVCREFHDASHNAWAYRVGFGPGAQTRSHDDGEPGGTAGRPMLAAIEGSEISDVVVVATRYFGGVKLGAGGLARAYGRAAREALAALETRERIRCQGFRISLDYGFLEPLRRLVGLHEGKVEGESYDAQVEARVSIPLDRTEDFLRALAQASGGKVRAEPNEETG